MSELKRMSVIVDYNSANSHHAVSVEIDRDGKNISNAGTGDNPIKVIESTILNIFSDIDFKKVFIFYRIVQESDNKLAMVRVIFMPWNKKRIEQIGQGDDLFVTFAKTLIKTIDLYKAQE
jgi:hypothetical protein